MKIKNRYNVLVTLMVISQVVITGFTAYWLNSQFMQEKERLVRDLTLSYKTAYNQALDSMLIEHYITPVLGDSVRQYFNVALPDSFGGGDPAFEITSGGRFIADGSGSEGNGTGTLSIRVRGDDTAKVLRMHSEDVVRQEMMLRSVKLIVMQGDSAGGHASMLHGAFYSVDTALFTNSFETILSDEGFPAEPVWVHEAGGQGAERPNRVVLIGNWDYNTPVASIDRYRIIVAGRILPQIMFGVLLFILTGSAFILAWFSLRKEVRLNLLRRNFVSNVSHELKTPVSTLMIAIDTLRKGKGSGDRAQLNEYLDIAAGEVKRLEKLITRVLDNSVMEEGGPLLKPERTGLREIVGEVIESSRPAIEKAGGTVILEEGEEVFVTADRFYLLSVLTNLLDNSLKYAVPEPRVIFSISKKGTMVHLTVRDNGPGIPEQYRSKVFEKFFRVPEKDTHNVKGYGLGLSFVKSVVEMHNGRVETKNLDEGCIFTIKLPL